MLLSEFRDSVNLPRKQKGFDGYSISYIEKWITSESQTALTNGLITQRQYESMIQWKERVIKKRLK